MATYQLHFTIPQQRQGERQAYKAFTETLRTLGKLQGKRQNGTTIQDVEVTGGSVRGFVNIESPSYQEALSMVCRNSPILDLEWHLEERVEPTEVERILNEAMKK